MFQKLKSVALLLSLEYHVLGCFSSLKPNALLLSVYDESLCLVASLHRFNSALSTLGSLSEI
jgi:hypothetical protein